ncbi:MAG TPA: PIN domain-containing protein [Anaerolineales bacterium]|nr:PIN domain-containing protein [Anaerolineales bacterium]HLO32022.1 PIN domain-containing protein [Anaerolineales bacterium]
MEIFIDTSALYAFISEDDRNHELARQIWGTLLTGEDKLLTNSYILVESITLIQQRLGIKYVRAFLPQFTPILHVDWLGQEQHSHAIEQLLTADRRQLSLVDCSSFETMRRLGIKKVFSFDEHFREQDFEVIP